MPRSRASLIVVLGAAVGLLSGCGGSGAPNGASHRVQVSLIAPTDGSEVTVANIEVLGTITPRDAALRVFGKRVRVRHGAFRARIVLHRGVTRIRIKASARGFLGSSMTVSVRYAPPHGSSVAATEGQTEASDTPAAASSSGTSGRSGDSQSGGGITSGVGSLSHRLGSAIDGRANGCGGTGCGLIP